MTASKQQQVSLFDAKEAASEDEATSLWRAEWQGMPEFVQEKQRPFAQIIVRFETEADLQAFAALIGQKLTPKTKSIWHPHRSHWSGPSSGKAWVDNEDT